MKMEDFNKLVFAFFGIYLFGIIAPMLIGAVLDYFLPRCHYETWLPIFVWWEEAIIIVIYKKKKKKEKKEIPGPGDKTPWDNDDIQDGGKI